MDLLTDNSSPGVIIVKDYNPDGTHTSTATFGTHPIGMVKQFTGSRDGRFIKGQLRLNPVVIKTVTYGCVDGFFQNDDMHPVWGRRSWEGAILPGIWSLANCTAMLPGDHGLDESMAEASLQGAYANVRKPDFDGQLFLAELGETVAMIRSPLKGLLKTLSKAKNARHLRRKLSSFGDLTADGWLQYVYGIKPLINDIATIFQLCQRKIASSPLLRAGGQSGPVSDSIWQEVTATLPYGLTLRCLLSGGSRRSVYSKVYFNQRWGSNAWDIVERWGLNPLALPVTFWQRVPCSFVADWFYMIGPWLQSLQPHPDLDMLGNCISEKYETDYRLEVLSGNFYVSNPPAQFYQVTKSLGEMSYVDRRLIRVVNRPVPAFPCMGPGLRNLSQSISLGLLSWQRLPKIKR